VKVFIFAFILICAGCESKVDVKKREYMESRHYKTNDNGVRYFLTCIEGFEFIGTHSGHGTNVSGPIGKCITKNRDMLKLAPQRG